MSKTNPQTITRETVLKYLDTLGPESGGGNIALNVVTNAVNTLYDRMEDPDTAVFGPEVFRFTTFSEWVNKADTWFAKYKMEGTIHICIDAKHRVCKIVFDFMRARDEDTFPVTVHRYRKPGEGIWDD